ncbi:S-adenosyl-L-methionine-dependent methyltransferase [Coniophora puteana RWD-64-598 SS2]|uniref:S-adenosyl-L-methionine-dependent methyltransferase n=1 Tax=Coniophora puteana (strain RWD-64-598) TaxID=741705 RepID=A0A5M3MWJ6_CONPW|nr:S-adenosyl-L-methionine-dependent methyltransferase [Coniophora puteana RWD-64-598 SS2]EIW83522.1 S-adenosyl-L-methionine-dependent methyltransferase [Coniophora puteana RWD-64-598 SS2]
MSQSAFTPAKDRKYHDVEGAAYILPADQEEASSDIPVPRLNAQYLLLKEVFNGTFLYAPMNVSENDCVLDNGTGTGIWVADIRAVVPPTVSIYGIDLQTRLAPPNPPPNTHFLQGSFLDLPADWTGKFALVNQRLMVAALTHDNWKKAISEIYRVLKPGGYVQILEAAGGIFAPEGETDERIEMYNSITALMRARRGIGREPYMQISGLLEAQGFRGIVMEERRVPLGNGHERIGEGMLQNYKGLYQGYKAPVLEAGGLGLVTSEVEYDELVEGLVARCNERQGVETRWFTFYAQKP